MRYPGLLALFIFILGTSCQKAADPVSVAGNTDPVIESVTFIPETIKLGESCLIQCNAFDDDNDKLQYEWEAGIGHVSGSGKEVYYTADGCCGSPFLNVTVKDGKGGSVTMLVIIPARNE